MENSIAKTAGLCEKHLVHTSDTVNAGYDVVVIGAGMGGLTAAALLAKAGLSVFVADMNRAPGGVIAGFSRDGFRFETAVHWLNLFGPAGPARRIMAYIKPAPPETPAPKTVRRFKGDSFDYTLTEDPDVLRDALVRDHPRDERGIIRFFEAARRMGTAFNEVTRRMQSSTTLSLSGRARLFRDATAAGMPFLRYSGLNAEAGLRRFFPHTRAGQIFCSEARFLTCLVPIGWIYTNNYFLPPRGGARTLADWLCDASRERGAHFQFNTRAVNIELDRGRAAGVTFRRRADQTEYHVRCRHLIAACDTETLYTKLLPARGVGGRVVRRIRRADLYSSAVTISLGLDRPARDFGVGEEMVYLTRDDVPRAAQDAGDPHTARITLMSSSSADPTLAPPGKGTLSVYLPAKLSLFDNWRTGDGFTRGAAYRDWKRQYADIIVRRIEASLVPDLRSAVELVDVATPVTYLRYTGNRDGTIMGTRMSFKNVMRSVSGYATPISNLYIGGQWAEYSGGVPTAIRAGANSAMLVLKQESKSAFKAAEEMFER